MRKLLFLLPLLLLFGEPAQAQQQVFCPKRLAGDKTNACASTSFLASAIGGNGVSAGVPRQLLDGGPGASGNRVYFLNANATADADTYSLFSVNQQVQPGSLGFGGTWVNGDIASFEISWAGGSDITFSCVVGTTCNGSWGSGTSTVVIAGALNDAFIATTALTGGASANCSPPNGTDPLFCANGVSASTPSAGFNGFFYLTTWPVLNAPLTITNRSTTALGTFSSVLPPNLLDGPTGLFLYRSPPSSGAGAARIPQAGDPINYIQFLGPITADPTNGGYNYAMIAAFIDDPATPTGRFDFHTNCAAGVGANGCLRASLRQGLSLPNSAGTSSDHGQGTLGATAGVYVYDGTAVPAGGTAGVGLHLSSVSNFGIFFGSSAPTLSAAQGSLYLRSDGTANNRLYINTNGSTGWTAFNTAS